MITLFGATGFTGRLIAQELDQSDLPFRLAGRSNDKLSALSSLLSTRPEWIVADASKVSSLPALFRESNVLINCAGPYTDLGEKVIAQAAMSGSAYIDVTNELGFYYRIRGYNEMARRTGSLIVPACGFEVALADCAVSILSSQLMGNEPDRPLETVDVIYELANLGSSKGTRRSTVRSLATSWIAYNNGEWVGSLPGSRTATFSTPNKKIHAFSFPSCESITLPSHVRVKRINCWMSGKQTVRLWATHLIPLLARLSRSIFRPLILNLAAKDGWSSDVNWVDIEKINTPFEIIIICKDGKREQMMSISGNDPYHLTAKIAAYTSKILYTKPANLIPGFLAPSQVLNPDKFMEFICTNWGIKIEKY